MNYTSTRSPVMDETQNASDSDLLRDRDPSYPLYGEVHLQTFPSSAEGQNYDVQQSTGLIMKAGRASQDTSSDPGQSFNPWQDGRNTRSNAAIALLPNTGVPFVEMNAHPSTMSAPDPAESYRTTQIGSGSASGMHPIVRELNPQFGPYVSDDAGHYIDPTTLAQHFDFANADGRTVENKMSLPMDESLQSPWDAGSPPELGRKRHFRNVNRQNFIPPSEPYRKSPEWKATLDYNYASANFSSFPERRQDMPMSQFEVGRPSPSQSSPNNIFASAPSFSTGQELKDCPPSGVKHKDRPNLIPRPPPYPSSASSFPPSAHAAGLRMKGNSTRNLSLQPSSHLALNRELETAQVSPKGVSVEEQMIQQALPASFNLAYSNLDPPSLPQRRRRSDGPKRKAEPLPFSSHGSHQGSPVSLNKPSETTNSFGDRETETSTGKRHRRKLYEQERKDVRSKRRRVKYNGCECSRRKVKCPHVLPLEGGYASTLPTTPASSTQLTRESAKSSSPGSPQGGGSLMAPPPNNISAEVGSQFGSHHAPSTHSVDLESWDSGSFGLDP